MLSAVTVCRVLRQHGLRALLLRPGDTGGNRNHAVCLFDVSGRPR